MSEPITLPIPFIEPPTPPRSKWEQEYQSFRRLLPQLLSSQRGRFVAVHEGQVVDSGDAKLDLALRVLAKVGNVAIHVGLVTEEPEPVSRSGVRRESRLGGGLPGSVTATHPNSARLRRSLPSLSETR